MTLACQELWVITPATPQSFSTNSQTFENMSFFKNPGFSDDSVSKVLSTQIWVSLPPRQQDALCNLLKSAGSCFLDSPEIFLNPLVSFLTPRPRAAALPPDPQKVSVLYCASFFSLFFAKPLSLSRFLRKRHDEK